jgi:hypothetical protein
MKSLDMRPSIPYHVIVLKAQGQIDLANRVGHLNARMRAGQNRCINNSPTLFIEQTFYRTGVLVNRLIELVFYKANKIELVFVFGRAAAAHPHTQFFCEFWALAAYAKFS